MKKAMLIVNPKSGGEKSKTYQKQVIHVLEGMAYTVTVCETQKERDATVFAEEACEQNLELVIAMGGDGTINEIVNGLAEKNHRPKFGFIPLGTVNDFARALTIPTDPEKAVSLLKNSTTTKYVDIGKINNDYFINVIAIGALAEATFQVSPKQKTKLGPLAYILEGVKALSSKSSFDVQIEQNNEIWENDVLLVLVTLTNSVGGFENLAPDTKVDDGKLHIFAIEEASALQVIKLAGSTITGNLKDNDKVTYLTTTSAKFTSTHSLKANVDGDAGSELPLDVKVLPGHIEIIVP